MINKQKISTFAVGVIAMAIVPTLAFAQDVGSTSTVRTSTTTSMHTRMPRQGLHENRNPVYAGRVSNIAGNTLTLIKGHLTYTVDVSNATITKGFDKKVSSISVADIKEGDNVSITGTAVGTTITAKTVRDLGSHKGMMNTLRHSFDKKQGKHSPKTTPRVSTSSATTPSVTATTTQ